MANEIIEETTEGTTQEPAQGTAGKRYLTKEYLVRNLQAFWGKIKSYIEGKNFADESFVSGAVSDKATKKELSNAQSALQNAIDTKAEQSALNSLTAELTQTLANKVNKDGNKVLSERDFTAEYENKLNSLPSQAATTDEDGWMSKDDKARLDSLSEGAGSITVDTELIEGSLNPIANAVVTACLSQKADVEMKSNPQNLLNKDIIICSADTNGHITIDFPEGSSYVKIHTAGGVDSYRPIEKMVVKKDKETVFTNFTEKSNKMMSVTMENPEGKNTSGNWIISPEKKFVFYVENLKIGQFLYNPFTINVVRGNSAATARSLTVTFTNTV